MLEYLLIFSIPSVWSAPWWTAVGAVATVIAALGSLISKTQKRKKSAMPFGVSNSAGVIGSNSVAIGKNIRQDIVVNHYSAVDSQSAHESFEDRKQVGPSFWEIMDSIDGTNSDYDRHHIAAKYANLKISWLVKLGSMNKAYQDSDDDDLWILRFEPIPTHEGQKGGLRGIVGVIKLADYPNAKAVSRGHLCWISAQIRKAEHGDIWLQDGFQLSFAGM